MDQTCHLTQSEYTDSGPTSPNTDSVAPGAWQGCYCLQHASVSHGRICSDSFMCCHTVIQVADQTFHLTQSQYTDTGPTSPKADPITPGVWQSSHWECQFLSYWYVSTREISRRKRELNPGPSALEADALTTRPTRRCQVGWPLEYGC